MVIDDATFFTLSANRRSIITVASLFGLTAEEIDHPSCGKWIADCIQQLQTAQLQFKALKMRQHENMQIAAYETDPFKNKPNPLMTDEILPPTNA